MGRWLNSVMTRHTHQTSGRNRRTSWRNRLFITQMTNRLFRLLLPTNQLRLLANHPTDILLTLTAHHAQGEKSSSPTQSISLVGQLGLCLVGAQTSVSLTSADGMVTLSSRLVTPFVSNIQIAVCFKLLHWPLVGQSQKQLMQCTP